MFESLSESYPQTQNAQYSVNKKKKIKSKPHLQFIMATTNSVDFWRKE